MWVVLGSYWYLPLAWCHVIGYKVFCILAVSMLGTAVSISLLHFREYDGTGKTSEGKPENNWGFSLAKEKWKDHLPDLSSTPAVFWAVPPFQWWKNQIFFFIFPIHMPQCTEEKLNCPIFITLLAVLAQYCAWSYRTKRRLLHRRHMPCLRGTDSSGSSLSHGLWINLLVFTNRQMEVEGLSSSVIQLTNIWLINIIWNCSATTK